MPENGPRTAALEERFRLAANELEHRVTELESQMRTVRAIGSLVASVITGVIVVLLVHVFL